MFQPEIFERDISSMIEATKPKSQRKAEGTSMGFWERRRHIKEAKDLLRVGAQVEDLHEALKVVAKQGEQWHQFVPHGGWPGAAQQARRDHLHPRGAGQQYDRAGYRAFHHTRWWQSGNRRFREGGSTPKALLDDRKALDTLPERCLLEQEFASAGLNELGRRSQRSPSERGAGARAKCSWPGGPPCLMTCRSSAIISNDGCALRPHPIAWLGRW